MIDSINGEKSFNLCECFHLELRLSFDGAGTVVLVLFVGPCCGCGHSASVIITSRINLLPSSIRYWTKVTRWERLFYIVMHWFRKQLLNVVAFRYICMYLYKGSSVEMRLTINLWSNSKIINGSIQNDNDWSEYIQHII